MTKQTSDASTSANSNPAAAQLLLEEEIRAAITAARPRIKQDLTELVSYNSVHNEPGCEAAAKAAAAWVADAVESIGIERLDVETHDTADGSIAILGYRAPRNEAPTVLLYAHYDVVPAGDPAKWTADPFTLDERNGRWYGRGTADCKGNLVMHLAVLRTLNELAASHPQASGFNDLGLRIVIEGSEERGGEGLDALIDAHPDKFTADAILIADTGNIKLGEPTLTTCLRGGGQLDIRVDTLATQVHSGSFGGAAPDAVAALVRILDSLRDETGAITIDGVDCSGRWHGAEYPAEQFKQDATVLDGVHLMAEGSATPADQVWARPAVSITGFTSTPVAEAVNAVPNTAAARLNLRVPPGLRAEEVATKLREHLINHAPWGVHVTVDILECNDPFQTDTSGPAISLLGRCLSTAFAHKPLQEAGAGGSIPLCNKLVALSPNAELALFGVEEPQCTIHSIDESVSPEELLGIATAEALFLANITPA